MSLRWRIIWAVLSVLFFAFLTLANLAPGQYLLEINGKSEGHKPVTELLAFRLTS